MLESLHIENMAVIERLDVDFLSGLCVITGETGAGKSVMLDALGFLLGGKPAKELVRHGTDMALVSGVFSDPGEACIRFLRDADIPIEEEWMLQRTLSADGKTKCRLNGRAIPQAMLRELAGYLISIHGQNDNQMLLRATTQQQILDSLALTEQQRVCYSETYAAYRETKDALGRLKQDSAEAMRLADMLRFQVSEIDAAHLKEGEEEELLQKRSKLQNAEKIAKQSEFVYRVLYGSEKGAAALLLERASQAMHQLSGVIPEAAQAAEKLLGMRYEVEDIANTARDLIEDVEGDPTAALNRVEGRLDAISKLRRKYGEDIAAVLRFRNDAADRLSTLEHSEEEEQRLTAELQQRRSALQQQADALHVQRAKAAKALSGAVLKELSFLDMPAVRFEVQVSKTERFGPDGNDEVSFLIATNPGDSLQPLSRIASGGELARIMLALKSVLNDRDGVSTAVFDEVDTGISGKTSGRIGVKLSEIGRRTQVLCVTHSAQIASLASTHYKISKHITDEGAFSTVKKLDEQERVEEIARILGGLSVTQAQRDAARDMIEEGRAFR